MENIYIIYLSLVYFIYIIMYRYLYRHELLVVHYALVSMLYCAVISPTMVWYGYQYLDIYRYNRVINDY